MQVIQLPAFLPSKQVFHLVRVLCFLFIYIANSLGPMGFHSHRIRSNMCEIQFLFVFFVHVKDSISFHMEPYHLDLHCQKKFSVSPVFTQSVLVKKQDFLCK